MSAILDGVDQYFSTGNGNPMITTTPFTMACWMYPTDITSAGVVTSVTDNGTDIHMLQPTGSIGGDPVRAGSYDGSWSVAATSTGYTATTWQHVAGVFTNSTSRAAFLDGGGKGTATGSQDPSGMLEFLVGSHKTTGGSYFDGKIAHVAIWDIALSDAEVAQLAAGALPTAIQSGNLVGYWKLIENGTKTTGTRDLTAYNSPTFDSDDPLAVLKDSYTSDSGSIASVSASNTEWAQAYTPATTYDVTSVKLKLRRTGLPGTMTVELQDTSSGLPGGTVLATGTYDADTLSSVAGTWTELFFDDPYAVTASTQYAIVIHCAGATGLNNIDWWYDSSGSYTGGYASRSTSGGSSWTAFTSIDLTFEVWGTAGVTVTVTEDAIILDGTGDFDVSGVTYTMRQSISLDGVSGFSIGPVPSFGFEVGTVQFPFVQFHRPGFVRHEEGFDPRHDAKTPIEMPDNLYGSETDESLPVLPIQDLDAVHQIPHQTDNWFEHLHLLPRLVQELGNVVSQQSFAIDLYNADRENSITITSITDNLDPGIEVTGVPATPFVIESQESMTALCVISTTGGFNIDSDYTFHDENGDDYTLYVTGSRIVLLPIRPETPMREHLIFDTKILEAVDGSEQRIAMRKTPRSMFEMTIQHDNRRKVEMLLFDRQAKIVACPAWHEPAFLTSDITAGDFTVNVNTTDYANFYVGGHAIIFQDEYTYDALLIDSMTATSLTFDSAIAGTYASSNKKVHVMPLMTAWMNANVAAAKNLYNQQTFNLRLDVGSVDNDIADASGWSTYDSKVFLDDPNMVEGNVLNEALETKVLVVDNMTGVFDRVSQWAHNKRNSVKGFKSNDREELWKLRQLFHYLRAQQVSFYIPTFSKDLIPNQTLNNASNIFVMDNIGYTTNAYQRAPKDYFRMHLKDGTILTRNIVGSAEISTAQEQITVDVAWPYDIDPDDIERCEFLEKVRINVDDIVITHYNALGQAKCFVQTKEVFD